MKENIKNEKSHFGSVLELLPQTIRKQLRTLTREEMASAEEMRIRIGQAITVMINNCEVILRNEPATKQELDWIFEVITRASSYSVNENLKAGFVTVKGGIRVGVCGTTIVKNGEVTEESVKSMLEPSKNTSITDIMFNIFFYL